MKETLEDVMPIWMLLMASFGFIIGSVYCLWLAHLNGDNIPDLGLKLPHRGGDQSMQLVWVAVIGICAAGVVSLFTPLAIKAGRALQRKIHRT